MSLHDLIRALDHTADGALITDKEQSVIYWNPAAVRMLGFARAEVVGRPCYEVLRGCHDEDRAVCQKHCQVRAVAMAGEPVTDYDLCVYTGSGDEQWVNMSTLVFAVQDTGNGRVLVHLFRDATRAVQNKGFVQRVLDAADHLRSKDPMPVPSPMAEPLASIPLTPREREVLALLARGLDTGEMADVLSISAPTVRNHIRNILGKFGVHSRLEAVLHALQHGLVSTNDTDRSQT
jgi:PAS domain S-box-containing protein